MVFYRIILDINTNFTKNRKMDSEIILPEETKIILENYFNKRKARKEKRLSLRRLQNQAVDKSTANITPVKRKHGIKKNAHCFKTNMFSKHIANIEKVKFALDKHETVGGLPMQIEKNDEQRIEAASSYLENAMSILESFTKVV